MTTPKPDVPNVIMLPPILVLLHIIAGTVLNWFLGGYYGAAWGWVGLLLLGACFGIVVSAKKLFDAAGTPVPPNQPATAIVTTGIYKYTRNPMYLAFVLGYIGLSFLASAPFTTLLVIPLIWILDQKVIVPEEQYLTEKFGAVYTDYKSQVRRWI